jgi:hypothetical protein
MRWVEACRLYPARCSVLPQLGGNHPAGYVDTGQDTLSGERVYVSRVAVDMMAASLGYRRPGDETATRGENERLKARVAELEQQAGENARVVEAAQTLRLAHELAAAWARSQRSSPPRRS